MKHELELQCSMLATKQNVTHLLYIQKQNADVMYDVKLNNEQKVSRRQVQIKRGEKVQRRTETT